MPIEIVDYMQGRSPKSVGFSNYLAKKEIAVQEYMKLFEPKEQEQKTSKESLLEEQNEILRNQFECMKAQLQILQNEILGTRKVS